MNAFADTLLSILFGWLRTLVEGIWSASSSGRFQRLFVWLGDNWYWVLIALCILCTVMDYLIWLIRWRPYIIWRNKLRRLFNRKDRADAQFAQGYDSGVDVDLTGVSPTPVQEPYAAWQPDAYWRDKEQEPAFVPPAEEQVYTQPLFEAPEAAPVYEQPAIMEEPLAEPTVRNRRSQRYEKKKLRLPGLLGNEQDENNAMLDGLPPVVKKEDAFHAPVYPDQYQNQ